MVGHIVEYGQHPDADKLSVTVFEGDSEVPADNESAGIWKSLGIPDERIYFLPREDNWWGPAGATGPCGPDTEMFIDTGKEFFNFCGHRMVSLW